jgi:hypothetical protein
MPLTKILVCLDPDAQPSVFDSIVAIDTGVDHLLRHGNVTADQVRGLVYGAMFTRGPRELANTAVFVGGSEVAAGEEIFARTKECFFGPMRVSVMFDPNGSNTTAAAAVLAAGNHVRLGETTATVLAATGPVGQRVVRLLASEGAKVRVASRKLRRAEQVCREVCAVVQDSQISAHATNSPDEVQSALDGAEVVVAAGAPGVELLPIEVRQQCSTLRLAIDLNAVPPVGIGGIGTQDEGIEQNRQICYGAIGVGRTRMRIHRRAIQRLFEANDLILDAEEIYAIGKTV